MSNYKLLENITRENAKDIFATAAPVFLPLGATEQHGGHLPLGTDTFLANEFVKRVAAELGGLILPALPYGYSWSWREIEGTITIRQETLMAAIRDISESLNRFKVNNLIIITGHEANRSAMKYICRDLVDDLNIRVIYLFYPGFDEVAKEHMDSPLWNGIIHAEEFETSLMLDSRPELVEMDKVTKEYPEIPCDFACTALSIGKLSSSGVYGDATVATAEKGEKFWQILVERTVGKLQNILYGNT